MSHGKAAPTRHGYELHRFHVELLESTLKAPERRRRRKQVNPIERARSRTLGMHTPSNQQGAEEGTLQYNWLGKALFLAKKTERKRSLKT